MKKIILIKLIYNFYHFKYFLFLISFLACILILSIKILSYFSIDTNLASVIIGGIISLTISYYFFYKTRLITIVKEKKENAYIPILKELIHNFNLLKYDVFTVIAGNEQKIISTNTINNVLSNKEYYLLSEYIILWIYEYLDANYQYTSEYEYEYNVFKSFLKRLENNHSIEIEDIHYKEEYFTRCIKATMTKDASIIGDINLVKNNNPQIVLKDVVYNWCYTKYNNTIFMERRNTLFNQTKDLINILDYLITKINKKYLTIIEYI